MAKFNPLESREAYANILAFICNEQGKLGGLLEDYPWIPGEKDWFVQDRVGFLKHHVFSYQQRVALENVRDGIVEDVADCLGPQLQTSTGANISK
jgi:hypothetical protein